MPYYVFHNMDADDADAIVAYLRTVPGVNNTIPRRAASFDVPAPAPPLDATKIPVPADHLPEPGQRAARAATWRRRRASASSATRSTSTPGRRPSSTRPSFFAGGEDFSALFASTLMIHPVSKNITSDNGDGPRDLGGRPTS